jgi:hypothetical protein
MAGGGHPNNDLFAYTAFSTEKKHFGYEHSKAPVDIYTEAFACAFAV